MKLEVRGCAVIDLEVGQGSIRLLAGVLLCGSQIDFPMVVFDRDGIIGEIRGTASATGGWE